MFKLICQIPRTVNLAFSGGVDSVSVAHFLKNGRRNVTLLHFNHGCEYSDSIEAQCRQIAEDMQLPIVVGKINESERKPGQSLEDFWRRSRYRFLRFFEDKFITCHHLDDAAETWVWSALHGNPRVIPVSDDKVIRPFLTTPKEELQKYALINNLPVVADPYNDDLHLMRNYIRARIMPHAKVVNPGLLTVVRKMYLSEAEKCK